jgi:hypothetical protein
MRTGAHKLTTAVWPALHTTDQRLHALMLGKPPADEAHDASAYDQVGPPVKFQKDPANMHASTLSAAKQRKFPMTGSHAARPVVPQQVTPAVAHRASSPAGATPHRNLGPL